MLEGYIPGMISGRNHQQRDSLGPMEDHQVWRQLVPGGLLSRVFHALPWGILVISGRGRVSFYNRTYAQLRGIALGAFLGHPVEQLDRRHRIRELLHTGQLPSERTMGQDRRTNREVILPLWEGSDLEPI